MWAHDARVACVFCRFVGYSLSYSLDRPVAPGWLVRRSSGTGPGGIKARCLSGESGAGGFLAQVEIQVQNYWNLPVHLRVLY